MRWFRSVREEWRKFRLLVIEREGFGVLADDIGMDVTVSGVIVYYAHFFLQ